MNSKKEKAHVRFKQVNALCDVVVRRLEKPIHGLVLLLCWRHADEKGYFDLSHNRIAEMAGISRRYAIQVMEDLERVKAVRTMSVGGGKTANRYRLGEPSKVVNCGSPPPQKE